MNKKARKGSLLVELLIGFGIAAILLPALLTGIVATREGKSQEIQRVEADLLLRETVDAVKSVRQNGWVAFAIDGTFYPQIVNGAWRLTPGSTTINGFTQSLTISPVQRDNAGKIVTTGGSDDPSTKQVVATISWTQPYNSLVTSTLYLTRYRDNLANIETTETQFNLGSQANVKVQSTSPPLVADDGEIVLSQTGGYGDWCTPSLTFTALDLPKNGVANAISAIQGQAAIGTGDNASGVSFANVTITDPSFPTAPVASVSGTFDGYKTNGVFTENYTTQGVNKNYAYLTTDTNTEQGVILDLNQLNSATNKYTKIGTLNLQSSSVNGTSIYVSNDIAYMTASNGKLYLFNLTTRTGTHTPISSVALAGVGNKIVVVGSNAYIAVGTTSNQLQIVDVSNSLNPTIPQGNSISVNGAAGRDVFVNVSQNRAYLVTAQSGTKPEFFLINLATKSVLGSYDTSGHGDMDPKGVVAVSGARVIIVGMNGQEYQVLRVDGNYESSPTWCGGLDVNTGINGIATVFTQAQRAYSYIITGDQTAEYKIIEGGPGAGNGSYAPTGTFISQPIGPTTLKTGFNSFSATINQPVANDVQVYVSVANVDSNNLCVNSNYTFVGVNGGATAFQTTTTGSASISGTIPFGSYAPSYANPGRCFKYKVILSTTDSTLTPVFNDLTINYSP